MQFGDIRSLGVTVIPNDQRLDGWKAIANYLGRERSTAIRWAKTRGLPVHRIPGGRTATVYALPSELDVWLSNDRVDQVAPTDGSAQTRAADASAVIEGARRRGALVALSVLGLCFLGALWWHFARPSAIAKAPVSIAAVALRTATPETAEFARALGVDLTRFATASASLAVFEREPDARLDTQYVVRTEIERLGGRVVANARLIEVKNGEVLWSQRYQQSQPGLSILREQIAADIVGMLQCSFGTLDYERSTARAGDVALLMAICQDYEDGDFGAAQTHARQLTAARPDLAVGWAWLAVAQGNMLGENDSILKRTALANADRAKKIGPDKACTWLARAAVAGRGFTSPDALPFIEKGLNQHPDNPYLLAQHSLIQFNLGYVRDSVAPALTAMKNDPSSLRSRDVAIRRLAAADRVADARRLQDENEKLWPDHPQTAATRADLFPNPSTRTRADLAAVRDNEAMVASSPHLAYRLAGLYERNGDRRSALQWLARAPVMDTHQAWSQLFSPDAAGLRSEPAFFRKMADLGLVGWWVAHGRWPDFCAEPGLKYDCAIEAEKLGVV